MKLKPGQIIEEFEIGGRKVVCRVLKRSDLNGCLRHINSLVKEKALIAWQKPFTMKKEKEWLENELKEIKEGKHFTIVAEVNGKIIGTAFAGTRPMHAVRHRAQIGIGLTSERGKGIGFRLMKALERIAVRYLDAKMLELTVYEPNKVARSLYKKCGFREAGRIHKGCYYYGRYFDEIIMIKEL